MTKTYGEIDWNDNMFDDDLKTPIENKYCPICNKQMYDFDAQGLHGIQCEDFQCFSIAYFYGKPELVVKGHLYDYEDEIEVYKKLNRCNAISQQNADEYIKSLAGLPTTNFIEPPDFDICSKCNTNKVEQDHFIRGSNGVGFLLTRPICNACVNKW